MDSSQNTERTPRRSARLQRIRNTTPEPKQFTIGPRAMMKLNKSKQKLEMSLQENPGNISTLESLKNNQRGRPRKRKTMDDYEMGGKFNDNEVKVENEAKIENVEETEGNLKADEDLNVGKNIEKLSENDLGSKEFIQVVEKNENSSIVKEKSPENDKKSNELIENNQNVRKSRTNSENSNKITQNVEECAQNSVQSAENVKKISEIAENIEKESENSQKSIKNAENDEKIENEIGNGKIENEIENSPNNEEKSQLINDFIPKSLESSQKSPNLNQKSTSDDIMNTTPPVLDASSIISLPETPLSTQNPPKSDETENNEKKDATFSPEVDTSIQDSRPHIDVILNTTPTIHRSKPIRTSTPLAQKLLKRDTPTLSAPVLSALSKVLSPKIDASGKISEESLNETLSGQFKMVNPLEKSILKKNSRKRSLSVADGESFMQKKVVFVSNEIIDIDSIDVKMLQSFREEKENSILKQNIASGGKRARRSMSETPGSKIKTKIPNFKAIHEQQFKKMESIVDHIQRKAERAVRLATPSKTLAVVPEKKASKIPMVGVRKPLSSITAVATTPNRTLKRSQSVDVAAKASKIPKFGISAKSESNLNVKVTTNFSSNAGGVRKKLEERREKNFGLYKGHAVKSALDNRKKTEMMIKGVRLNRRFELQMQHRFGSGENSEN